MKRIFSKKSKNKNNKSKLLKKYWNLVFPSEYVSKMVSFSNNDIKKGHFVDKLNIDKFSSVLKDVALYGRLKKNKDGFVYLDVPDDIIDVFYKMLDEKNKEKPPYDKTGAHISVMYSDESENIEKIEEIGSKFNFRMKDVYFVNPEGWDEMDRVWFIQVDSQALENLRRKYGLSKKLNGHEFHITFAVRKK